MKLQKIAAIVFLMGGCAMIHGQAQVVINDITSGDAGGGLTLLSNSAGAVSFASGIPSSLTIQGVTVTSDPGAVTGGNIGTYNGGYNGTSLGGDANGTALTQLLEGAEYSGNTY